MKFMGLEALCRMRYANRKHAADKIWLILAEQTEDQA